MTAPTPGHGTGASTGRGHGTGTGISTGAGREAGRETGLGTGPEPATVPTREASTPALALAGGTVRLGHRTVLRDIDLRVEAGELLAVLGPNGAGKSTLLRALLGLVPLTAGEARVHGTPVARFRDWGRIGYVPQRGAQADGVPATVWEVVASGRVARRSRFRPASAADRAATARALRAVGLDDRRRDSVHELSGGQWKRVQIARALAGEPDVLVMDEPAAGVDAASQAALARTLRELHLTVVVTLHELGSLEPLITRTVVLDDGRIAAEAASRAGVAAGTDAASPRPSTGSATSPTDPGEAA
jgi:zinc transport system ATP-binding protein